MSILTRAVSQINPGFSNIRSLYPLEGNSEPKRGKDLKTVRFSVDFGDDGGGTLAAPEAAPKLTVQQDTELQDLVNKYYEACKPNLGEVDKVLSAKLSEMMKAITDKQIEFGFLSFESANKDLLNRLEKSAEKDGTEGRKVVDSVRDGIRILEAEQEEILSFFSQLGVVRGQMPGIMILSLGPDGKLQRIGGDALPASFGNSLPVSGPNIDEETELDLDLAGKFYATALEKYLSNSADAEIQKDLEEERAELARTYFESRVFSGPQEAYDDIIQRLAQSNILLDNNDDLIDKELADLITALNNVR